MSRTENEIREALQAWADRRNLRWAVTDELVAEVRNHLFGVKPEEVAAELIDEALDEYDRSRLDRIP